MYTQNVIADQTSNKLSKELELKLHKKRLKEAKPSYNIAQNEGEIKKNMQESQKKHQRA